MTNHLYETEEGYPLKVEHKPCPHCGSDFIWDCSERAYSPEDGYDQSTDKSYVVICNQCGSRTARHDTPAEAFAAWQRRTP